MKRCLLLAIERDWHSARVTCRKKTSLWSRPLCLAIGTSILIHGLLLCSVRITPHHGEPVLTLPPLVIHIDLPHMSAVECVPPVTRLYNPHLGLTSSDEWNSSLSLCIEPPPVIEYEPLNMDFDYD